MGINDEENLGVIEEVHLLAGKNYNWPDSIIGNAKRDLKEGSMRYSPTMPKRQTARAQIKPKELISPKPTRLPSRVLIYSNSFNHIQYPNNSILSY